MQLNSVASLAPYETGGYITKTASGRYEFSNWANWRPHRSTRDHIVDVNFGYTFDGSTIAYCPHEFGVYASVVRLAEGDNFDRRIGRDFALRVLSAVAEVEELTTTCISGRAASYAYIGKDEFDFLFREIYNVPILPSAEISFNPTQVTHSACLNVVERAFHYRK